MAIKDTSNTQDNSELLFMLVMLSGGVGGWGWFFSVKYRTDRDDHNHSNTRLVGRKIDGEKRLDKW